VALLVSELATNAVVHARTPFRVTVKMRSDLVRVEVSDQAAGDLPVPSDVAPDVEGGRGLLFVDWLADRWGYSATAGGKTVWFELALSS
jgi:anti-sigma regulatory factor (Ser/Thr protein kinase)